MNLTALRRIVMLGSAVSLAAAGGAAWFALQAKAEARPPEAWAKAFPVKSGGASDLDHERLVPLTQYIEVTRWPQGEIPPKVDPAAAKAPEVKVDPFETKYKLNMAQVGSRPADSYAQLKLGSGGDAFSIGLGERIPESPGDPNVKAFTPWRLDQVQEGLPTRPASAVFTHVDTGEQKTLSAIVASGRDLTKGDGGGRPLDGATSTEKGKPDRGQPSRVIRIKEDRVKGEFEYEIPEEEVAWLGFYSDDEVKNLSVEETRDENGKPDGFRLKAVPANSRAYDMGFRSEDKIVSVNNETVTSTADALSKGRKQYDTGATTFQIKGIRKGKEVNYTFHATKKKDRGGK